MTIREQFEAWWEQERYDDKLSYVQGVMFNHIKANMFLAWQASREEIVVDLSKMNLLLCDQHDVVCELNKHGLKSKV